MQKISIEAFQRIPDAWIVDVYDFNTDTTTQETVPEEDVLNELEAVDLDSIPVVEMRRYRGAFSLESEEAYTGEEEHTRYVTLAKWESMKGNSLDSVFEKIINRRK